MVSGGGVSRSLMLCGSHCGRSSFAGRLSELSIAMPNHAVGLQRFVAVQVAVYAEVVSELNAGRKRSHWMWFVFPQLRGLGHSAMATKFGLASAEEALAYWRHPVLGVRLRECVNLVLAVEAKTAYDILGSPDDLKLRSCLTLFEAAVPGEPLFGRALTKLYSGQRDPRTLELLAPAIVRASVP